MLWVDHQLAMEFWSLLQWYQQHFDSADTKIFRFPYSTYRVYMYKFWLATGNSLHGNLQNQELFPMHLFLLGSLISVKNNSLA